MPQLASLSTSAKPQVIGLKPLRAIEEGRLELALINKASGINLTIFFQPQHTIRYVKLQIQQRAHQGRIEADKMRLIYNDEDLEDERTLESYNIASHSTLYWKARVSAVGVGVGLAFVSVCTIS